MAELEGRAADAEEERQALRAELRAAQAAAARATDAALVRALDGQNRQLVTRVAQLEEAAAEARARRGDAGYPAARASEELDQAHAALAAENARLQVPPRPKRPSPWRSKTFVQQAWRRIVAALRTSSSTCPCFCLHCNALARSLS